MATTTTYDLSNTLREDLVDVVTMIDPEETVTFSMLNRGKDAKSTYHEWSTDALTTANKDNAAVEGADPSFTVESDFSRTGNRTQIFEKTCKISSTQENVDYAGIKGLYNNRVKNKMKELKRDINAAILSNNSAATGGTGSARKMTGMRNFITTNVESGTGTASRALSEDGFNGLIQDIWDNSDQSSDFVAIANGYNKRELSLFDGGGTREYTVSGKNIEITVPVAIYYSDFGTVKIVADRQLTSGNILVISRKLWELNYLSPIKHTKLAKSSALNIKGQITAELTLTSFDEAGSGKITNLYQSSDSSKPSLSY